MDSRTWVMENFSDETFQIMDDVELFEMLCNIVDGAHNYLDYCNVEDIETMLEMGVVGRKMKKLWDMSGHKEYVFCYYLSFLPFAFTKEQIISNLMLKKPVPFIKNFKRFRKEYPLTNSDYLNSNTRIHVARMKHDLRNKLIDCYNHQAKIEHNHLLKEEPAIIQKEMMKEDSLVDIYNVYYGVREDELGIRYPLFLQKKENVFFGKKGLQYQFQEIPCLDIYYLPADFHDFSKAFFEPYQDYEIPNNWNYLHISSIIEIFKVAQQIINKNSNISWQEKYIYNMKIQMFFDTIDKNGFMKVRDLMSFHELCATCYDLVFQINIDYDYPNKQKTIQYFN